MSFTQITVTRPYKTAELTPAIGTLRFTPSAPMTNGDTVVAAGRSKPLDAEGDLNIVIAANNDPGTTPPGVSYEVREQIDGQPIRIYYVVIPYDAPGGTVDLSTLTPATVPPVVTYPITGPQGPQGIQGPPGAIATVNGDVGPAVVLDAGDVGAQPVDGDLTAIAALTPGNDDLIQRKAGAWTSRTIVQLRTDLDVAPAVAAGQYHYLTSTAAAGTSGSLGNGTLRLAPRVITRTTSWDRLGADIGTAGEAGSKLRLGVYADTGAGLPGALVLDAGQINGDSATVQELTVALTLAPGIWWFGAAVQSAPTTQPSVRTASNWSPPIPIRTGSSLPVAAGTVIGYSETGVTGALPANFNASPTSTGTVPRLLARAA
jgi:hypothetical protein